MKSIGSIPQPVQMIHPSLSQSFFMSSPPSLALRPKMDSLGEMCLMGAKYESGFIANTRENELESRSGSDNFEAGSGEDQNVTDKKSLTGKKYHRHTALQIQELESAFKENPHPDEKGRLELGQRLGLGPKQVKFWFQNRRTQLKTQLERHENSMLKQENDKLRFQNIAMKEAMRNQICENCGSPAILGEIPSEQHQLMIENERLKDELNRINILANKFLGSKGGNNGPMPQMMWDTGLDLAIGRDSLGGLNSIEPSSPLGLEFGGNKIPSSLPMLDVPFDKSLILELALASMDELLKLGQVDAPMWFRNSGADVDTLNLDEYAKSFSPSIGPKPGNFVTEATRASGTVILNGAALVEMLMDVNQWTEMFPGNIGRAVTVSVISAGVTGNRNGALHLMQAELQTISAMVPVRQVKFIRFCKQCRDDMWAVVDLSADFLFHGNASMNNSRRLPSGCIVQDLSNSSCSKVTWIEHTEYDETNIPTTCRPLVRSGLAFGAVKWLHDLQRQCELFATVSSSLSPNADHSALSPNGKKSIVKLARRMTRSFCLGISATVHSWEIVQNANDVRMMLRKSVGDLGEPSGLILSATTTLWLPLLPQDLFEFLRNEDNRCSWDVLCRGGTVQKMLHVPKSREDLENNAISVLRSNVTDPNANQTSVFILQDTCNDSSGSLVVYAAVETTGMNSVMSGGESSKVAILPSGFSVVPDCFDPDRPDNGNGSLLTIGFQILANDIPGDRLTMESVNTVKSLIAQTVHGIKTNLGCK